MGRSRVSVAKMDTALITFMMYVQSFVSPGLMFGTFLSSLIVELPVGLLIQLDAIAVGCTVEGNKVKKRREVTVVEAQVGPRRNHQCLFEVHCLLRNTCGAVMFQVKYTRAWYCVVQAVGVSEIMRNGYTCACVPVDQGIDIGIAKVLLLSDLHRVLKLNRAEDLFSWLGVAACFFQRGSSARGGGRNIPLYKDHVKMDDWQRASVRSLFAGGGKHCFIFTCHHFCNLFSTSPHEISGPCQIREPCFK